MNNFTDMELEQARRYLIKCGLRGTDDEVEETIRWATCYDGPC